MGSTWQKWATSVRFGVPESHTQFVRTTRLAPITTYMVLEAGGRRKEEAADILAQSAPRGTEM